MNVLAASLPAAVGGAFGILPTWKLCYSANTSARTSQAELVKGELESSKIVVRPASWEGHAGRVQHLVLWPLEPHRKTLN